MRSKGSIVAVVFFAIAAINAFSMESIGAGILSLVIAAAIWFFTIPSDEAKNEAKAKREKEQRDRLDKATRAQEQRVYAQQRKQYIGGLDFDNNPQMQRLLNDIFKTDYLDIVLMQEYLAASNQKFMFSQYGLKNMQPDELKKLAEYIKNIAQRKDPYTIKPIQKFVRSGGGAPDEGYFGVNHNGSIQYYGGGECPRDVYETIGYRLCNGNFDRTTGIYKVWDNTLRRYKRWDTNNARWID